MTTDLKALTNAALADELVLVSSIPAQTLEKALRRAELAREAARRLREAAPAGTCQTCGHDDIHYLKCKADVKRPKDLMLNPRGRPAFGCSLYQARGADPDAG
jgi:hypothetical protein